MIEITDSISIAEDELIFDFVRAGGPGGQKVNKTSSAVILRFDVNTPSLPDDVRERLETLAVNRISDEGILIIHARSFRSQVRNREDAVSRLVALIQEAAIKPKPRKKTRPSRSSCEKRLQDKKKHSTKKKNRNFKPDDDDY